MNSADFDWESLLCSDAPSGCSLKAALLTTYDRADERLLAEHLLPLLLKLSREPEGDGTERQFFLLELDRRLKQLHDRLVVVSSTVREEMDADPNEVASTTYGWIWRSIRHLTVGSRGRAVQHAKLWLMHWGAPDDGDGGTEYLEIVVSSSNLTMGAFKGQLQAAWRACVKLNSRRAEVRLRTWGLLPAFLQELAASAGAAIHINPFLDLLARAECPSGVSFLASVPGTHSRKVLRRTPWGAAGLKLIAPPGRGRVTASILTPYVGSWTAEGLRAWSEYFDGSPDRLELVWIDKSHPWARAKLWLLPKGALAALVKATAHILHLRHASDVPDGTDLFHEDHRVADDRWSHAKVYALRRGTSRRVIVTSANFSTAAWGCSTRDGELAIENFELGVCLEKGAWPFENLAAFENTRDVATVAEPPPRGTYNISWAQASWDGTKVTVDCRCKAGRDVVGTIKGGESSSSVPAWKVARDGRLRSAIVQWTRTKQPPSLACLTCGDEAVSVPVFDGRPPRDREDSLPPQVDEDVAQEMRDQLLFEQYGGRVAPEDSNVDDDALDGEGEERETRQDGESLGVERGTVAGGDEDDPVEGRRPDSYSVPAFVLARRHLRVVDNWADRVKRVVNNRTAEFEREWLVRDGKLLIDAFFRQAARDKRSTSANALGANLAAEELGLRLRHLLEA